MDTRPITKDWSLSRRLDLADALREWWRVSKKGAYAGQQHGRISDDVERLIRAIEQGEV